MTTDPELVEEVAKGLTKASRRAVVRMGETPVYEGGRGPAGTDAYSLWWGRDGGKGLTERPAHMESGGWVWTLTPLGLAVHAHLLANNKES